MIHIRVVGLPAPQGSLKAYVRGGHAALTSDNPKTRPWRHEVAAAAREACPWIANGVTFPRGTPVAVGAVFRFPLPKRWLTSKGFARPGAPLFPPTKPDRDKLLRAVGDALTAAGCIWDDDAQDAIGMAAKIYVPPGADVGVEIWIDDAHGWPGVCNRVDGCVGAALVAMESAIHAAELASRPAKRPRKSEPIDDLVARSSIGVGLKTIHEDGLGAELAALTAETDPWEP